MRHGVGALTHRDLGLPPRDHRPRKRGSEQVAVLVDGVPRDRREDEFRHEFLIQIFDEDVAGPGLKRALGDVIEVLLLPDVRHVRDHVVPLLQERLQDAGGVEPATVGQNDLLARHERLRLRNIDF